MPKKIKYTDRQIHNLLEAIYEGRITTGELPEDLYYAIADYLKDGVYEGFGKTLSELEFGGTDYELLNELRNNIYMFSGAKTYQQVREMSEQVADAPTFKEFRDAALQTYDQYNVDWLASEYNTAIAQAAEARQWQQIEADKDILPLIRYSAIEDENTSELCQSIDGTTLPVDDDFWDDFTPPNHFNCFKPDTLVLVPTGWRRIDAVKNGELIIGGSGNKHEITAVHINSFNGTMIEITIKNNSITATKNHRFLTINGWKCAENILIGDIIIQNIEVSFFNKIITAINNLAVIFDYLFMSIKRKWKAVANTFNTHFNFRQININKTTINQFISDCIKSFTYTKIKNNLFALCKSIMINISFFRVGIIRIYHFLVSFFSNFRVKHRIVFSHSNNSIRTFSTEHRGRYFFNDFTHFFARIFSPITGIYPLSFYSFATPSRGEVIFNKQSHKGSSVNIPFNANLSKSKHLDKINTGEGFTGGQPLDSFDTLFNFKLNAFFHRKFVLVKKIKEINYSGQIYNLSVNNDESYITKVGVVHNCRCVLEQLDEGKVTEDVDKLAKQANELIQPEFKMNAGKDGYIFNPDHPYFEVAKKDEALARNNFNLPIPDTDD